MITDNTRRINILIIDCNLCYYSNILNFILLRKKKDGSEGDWVCRYPDTNVRDIIIDYELEKAKKLDDAIHKIEDKDKK